MATPPSAAGPPLMKTCIRSSQKPDVTIVVGGQEFQEYSQALRCWSDYFDKALGSGMKESKTMRFEFPDRDPKEWQLITAIIRPLAAQRISKDNVFVVVSWFAELCFPLGLQECDSVLESLIEEIGILDPSEIEQEEEVHDLVLQVLEASLNYSLPKSKSESFLKVANILEDSMPTKSWVVRLVSIVSVHEEVVGELWSVLDRLLPPLSEAQKQVMIENGILPIVIFSHLEARAAKAIERMVYIANKTRNNGNFRAAVKEDAAFDPWKRWMKHW
jgi:BTB/POZ domain